MTREEFKVFFQKLKNVFAGYRRIDGAMSKKLRELGFSMVRQRKHYIFVYILNGKILQFEVDKTPGDTRSGIKTACDIGRIIRREAGLAG